MTGAVSGVFAQAAALLLYLALILAIDWPFGARRPIYKGACALSFFFALASTCFLPWTGIPIAVCLGLPADCSWFWYPSIVLAVFFAGGARVQKGAWLLCASLSMSSLAWFAYRNGVPGSLFSLEALGMLLQLEGLRNGRLCAAMILFVLSLALSFCEIPRSAVCRLTSFSYAAGLCLVFLPVNTIGLFPSMPVVSIPADFLLSLLLAILIQNGIFERVQNFLSGSRVHRTRLLTPALFALAGAYFLFTSIG